VIVSYSLREHEQTCERDPVLVLKAMTGVEVHPRFIIAVLQLQCTSQRRSIAKGPSSLWNGDWTHACSGHRTAIACPVLRPVFIFTSATFRTGKIVRHTERKTSRSHSFRGPRTLGLSMGAWNKPSCQFVTHTLLGYEARRIRSVYQV
jgi:hypothetical protein